MRWSERKEHGFAYAYLRSARTVGRRHADRVVQVATLNLPSPVCVRGVLGEHGHAVELDRVHVVELDLQVLELPVVVGLSDEFFIRLSASPLSRIIRLTTLPARRTLSCTRGKLRSGR